MLKELIKAILSGIMISIGACVYLSVENHVIGSMLFSLGLMTILCFKLNLFTGKIGYVVENHEVINVCLIWVGNFIGTFTGTMLLKCTRVYSKIMPALESAMTPRLNDHLVSMFILGIFCGMLMFIAVDTFKRYENIIGVVVVFLCVSVFILSGFEHSIANMAFFSLYGWSSELIIKLIVVTLGNSVGGMLIPLCQKIIQD